MAVRMLTEAQVGAMWATLKKRHRTKLVRKDKSRLMRIVAYLLDRMGIMSKNDFAEYWTTVKRTIYYPRDVVIGDGTQSELQSQVEIAAHEFTHVCQNIGYKYLFDKARLAKYETDAFIASMEMHHWLTGTIMSPEYYCRKLKKYGCGDPEIAYARQKFRMARKMVERGIYKSGMVAEIIELLG